VTTRMPLLASLLLACPLLLGAAVAAPPSVEADTCRDARGEPIACEVPVQISAPPPAPVERAHREREAGYVNFFPYFELADPSNVRFTPDNPRTVPEVERGAHLSGIGSGFDHGFGGLSVGVGYRPVPWLRLPELTFAFGYGDFEGTPVDIVGGGQSLTGALHECWMLRAQVAGGVDIDIDPVRLYVLAHVGIGGYFAQVDVAGSSIGGLGSDTYSATSFEAGWTAGMEIELEHDIAYTLGYRHVHTGVEQNTFFFGVNIRFE
jgi:hypothetical protein